MNTTPFDAPCQWIWSAEGIDQRPPGGDDPYRTRLFRRRFEARAGASLIVHLSCDSRYVLWCNGVLVGRGPGRGDIEHHFYDTYDVSVLLHTGTNVLAAMVICCGDVMPAVSSTGAPCSLMTAAPGFVLDSTSDDLPRLFTDDLWRVFDATAACRHDHCPGHGTYTGYTERFNASAYPWGWQSPNFDDVAWPFARQLDRAWRPDNVRDAFMPHRLVPRMIPAMDAKPFSFSRVLHQAGHLAWEDLIGCGRPLSLPPRSTHTVVVSSEALTTIIPRLSWSGGSGAIARLTYAEALVRGEKKLRAGDLNGEVAGVFDELVLAGARDEICSWQPWHYRTAQYVKLELTVGDEPLTLHRLDGDFWAYPHTLHADFESEDPFHRRLLDVCFHTLRLCSHEIVEDCPYHEQLTYAGDLAVQGDLSAYLSGDLRLIRQGLAHLDWSRTSEGLTRSRYPARMPQIIPFWSQFWVIGLYDYYWYSGDVQTVRDRLSGVDAVLEWFERRREDQGRGCVGALPYWCVLDWSPDWGVGTDEYGTPPGVYREATAAASFLHAWCLRCAADLHARSGGREATRYAALSNQLSAVAHQRFWSDRQRAYCDCSSQPTTFSQLTNALAVLSGVAPEASLAGLAEAMVNQTYARAAYFGLHYIGKALARLGRFDLYYPQLATYRDLIDTQRMSTLPEDPVNQRSDCHGWSAGPAYHLLASGLGITPAEPGFTAVNIAPQPGDIPWMRGHVPTPRGPVRVEVRRVKDRLSVEGSTPLGVPTSVKLPDGRVGTFGGGSFSL